jgi:hypothetical protein
MLETVVPDELGGGVGNVENTTFGDAAGGEGRVGLAGKIGSRGALLDSFVWTIDSPRLAR